MKHKVLFVDDEPRITRAMAIMLAKENYIISCAGSANEALSILERETIDIIVSDEKMPGMAGTDFLILLRRKYPGIIRILLTGQASSEAALKAVNEAQIYRFLTKPCKGLDLLITLRRALEYKDILKKTSELLNANEYQNYILQKIANEHSEIMQTARISADNVIFSQIKPEPESLLQELDLAIEKTQVLRGQVCNTTPIKMGQSSPQTKESPKSSVNKTRTSEIASAEKIENTDSKSIRTSVLEKQSLSYASLADIKPIMTRTEIRELLDDCDELKGMSPTVAQILKITRNPQCSIEQVVKVIKQDHAVSLKLLKLANSSAYTRGGPVDTIQKAVMRIGLTQIQQAVLNISVIDSFSNVDHKCLISAEQFWEHSIATGLIAAELTYVCDNKSNNIDIAFTMGLLHDIGRLVYMEMLGEKYDNIIETANSLQVPLEQAESRMLLLNHADAMDRILHKWKFPKELINPIALHQLSLGNIRRMAPTALNEVAILSLANRLAHALLLGSSGNMAIYSTEEFITMLRIKPEIINNIAATIPGQTDDIKFSLLASSNQLAWPCLNHQIISTIKHPFVPLCLSAEPDIDAINIFCNRITAPTEQDPNIAIVHITRGQERQSLTNMLNKAEQDYGVCDLPVIIISPKGDIILEDSVMAARNFELLPFPFTIAKFVNMVNKILDI